MIIDSIKKLLGYVDRGLQEQDTDAAMEIGDSRWALRALRHVSIGPGVQRGTYLDHRWMRKRGGFYINPKRESNPHIVIVGMSGFGKSTLLKSLIVKMSGRGKRIIIFDAHSEHVELVRRIGGRVYDPRACGINILALDGMSIGERISELVGVFKSMYGLGYIQATKLGSCLWYCYRNKGARSRDSRAATPPNFSDLMNELDIFIKNSNTSGERNTLMHLKYRLSAFNSGAFRNDVIDVNKISGVVLFTTGSLTSNETRFLYMHELMQRLYNSMHSSDREIGVKTYLFIDEAQFLVDDAANESGIIRKLIEEGRKYGFGVVMATHMSTRLPKAVIANASTFISFRAREPSEIAYTAGIIGGSDSGKGDAVKGMLTRLNTNEAIVISTSHREPRVVRMYDINRIMGGVRGTGMGGDTAKNEPDLSEPVVVTDGDMYRDRPDIESMNVETGNGVSESWIMRKRGNISIEHEVYVRKISDRFNALGVRHVIVDNSRGPDIIAYNDGKRVAVEYETGRKSIQATIRMLERRSREFDRVLVLVNRESYANYLSSVRIDGVSVMSADSVDRICADTL